MGYISVVCTNPDCALETTRLEDTEWCPKCGDYTQPVAGFNSQATPVAPMVNNNISPELLRSIANSKPIEFDGHDLTFIYSLLDKKQSEYLQGVIKLETTNENARSTKEYFDLCQGFEHAMKIMQLINEEFKKQRAKSEIHRRMTGFYSTPENIKKSNLVGVA
ncbi:hypothetical protein OLEAN_C08550 [Oleispira antarctica RB-8]|uniref:Uncharacterized protein n=1 Tax=Oleispira antarctica RB-8 TaxID=698738 RepID=R4YKH4_OLEAN|nr:hypothetical protein OLEAN_C08550 [Oleispira antarctica RB-8]